MLLSVAGYLTALGFAAWILGTWADYTGIAAIGAVIIVGVGAGVMVDGLQLETGQTEHYEYNTSGNDTVRTNTTIERQYEEVTMPANFPPGLLFVLLGAAGLLRALDEGGNQL